MQSIISKKVTEMESENEWPYLMDARIEASLQFQYGQASYAFVQHVYACEHCHNVIGLCHRGAELSKICRHIEKEILELNK